MCTVNHNLTDAQLKALEKIGQPGGHGIGEYSYIRRSSAEVLESKGLIRIYVRSRHATNEHGGYVRFFDWASATAEGEAYLGSLKAERDAETQRLLEGGAA